MLRQKWYTQEEIQEVTFEGTALVWYNKNISALNRLCAWHEENFENRWSTIWLCSARGSRQAPSCVQSQPAETIDQNTVWGHVITGSLRQHQLVTQTLELYSCSCGGQPDNQWPSHIKADVCWDKKKARKLLANMPAGKNIYFYCETTFKKKW